MITVIIKIALLMAIFIGVIGFFLYWFWAYHKVEHINEWSEQLKAIVPWWFLNNKLLSKENDHIRISALKYFLLYASASILLSAVIKL